MKIKKWIATISIFMMLVMSVCISVEASTVVSTEANTTSKDVPFEDVSQANSEIYASVSYVFRNDLMDGVSDTEFKPDDYLTRAMYVTILGRTAEIDTSAYTGTTFKDEKGGQWYTPYIEWAYENEITYGIGNGLFGVNQEVTREQIATFIARYLEAEEIELNEYDFSYEDYEDVDDISSWAVDGVDLMTRTEIMCGDEDGYFNPQDGCTRAEAAIIFARLDEAINGEDDEDSGLYEYIGLTGNDVIADFGTEYTRDTFEGEGIGYKNEGITFGLSGTELDSVVNCVLIESDQYVGFGLDSQMTFTELEEACEELGVTVSEPELTTDENYEDADYYCSSFIYDGYEFEYDWSSETDPNSTASNVVWIYPADDEEETAE